MDPRSHPAPAGQLVYEDFEPQCQWASRKDTDTLIVDLTGLKDETEFKKEHLKVKIDNYGNLKVSGERPLGGGNRWRRFQKVFRMADDCITTDIKAKFDNGVLSVAMPKLIKDQPSSTPQPPPAAAQTPTAAPAAPPAKPEPTGAATSRKRPEDGKRDTARDKKEMDPAAEKPVPPAAKTGAPKYGAGMRRRRRQVMGVVVVTVVVAAAAGLGFYYWSHWKGIGLDEHQQKMDICLSEY